MATLEAIGITLVVFVAAIVGAIIGAIAVIEWLSLREDEKDEQR